MSGKNPSVNIIWKIEGHWKIIVTFQNPGVMGRFSDGGKYPDDIVEGALSKVRQIRIADFIKEVVATRRWMETSLNYCIKKRRLSPMNCLQSLLMLWHLKCEAQVGAEPGQHN